MSVFLGLRRIFLAATVVGVSALAVSVPITLNTSPAEASALPCAQGGTCVVGDTGPGGGTVFFVTPSSGGFSESLSIPDTNPMCVMYRMCFDETIQLALTSSQVSALPFGYLEVAPVSAEATTSWAFTGCPNDCGARLTAIGTGETNSLAMVAARPSDTATQNAAKHSLDLVSGGKDDWYLPSIDELDLLFIRHRANNSFAGLRSDYYHSSTNNCGCARMIRFGDYHSAYVTIDASIRYFTRPIRSFGLAPAVAATSTTSTTSTTTTTVAPSSTTVAPSTTTVPQGQASVATIPKSSGTTTTTNPSNRRNSSVSTTSSSTSTTSTTVPVPNVPSASPGDGVLVIDGTETTVSVTRANNRVTVGASGVSMSFSGIAQDGTIIPLGSDGNLRITGGDSVSVEGTGFAANEDVEVWMFSTPQLLATVKADSNGKVVKNIKLSSALQEGDHRFVVDGKSANGRDALVVLGVIVGYESSGLSTIGKLLIALPIGLAIIFGLVIPTTLRRRRRVVPA
jgi:hypothetical protein